jgi:tRNA1Val (adenine37-N6)-methyltransferase
MKVTTDSCLFGAWVADQIQKSGVANNILDIGSGSGLLCLMIAQKTPAAINGIEIQVSDYQQSLDNIGNTPFKDRINLHQADALQFHYTEKYDIIVSNPPFYEGDLKGTDAGKNIAHHNEGLKLPQLLHLIAGRLNDNGSFYLLLPLKRLFDLQKLAAAEGLFINQQVLVHQTERHEAFRIMIRGSFIESTPQVTNIIIKDDGNYSSVFSELLKDYYLYL